MSKYLRGKKKYLTETKTIETKTQQTHILSLRIKQGDEFLD